jgi:putative transcriptional regulator
MSDPIFESRSFKKAAAGPDDSDGWSEEIESWDAIASSALIHRVRWHTGLTQGEFAAAYRIDPEYLRDLERGVVQPDSALVAYLMVIDRAPEFVRSALTVC